MARKSASSRMRLPNELGMIEMWSSGRIIQFSRRAAILACLCAAPALAQENQQPAPQQGTVPKPPQPYGGGTPLDVILNTRLWTDVPEAQDFVKATRPPEGTLEYQPTTGTDPVRPKLRTPAELKAMEDELERTGAAAERAAGFKTKNFHVEAKTAVSATTKPMHHLDAQNRSQ